MSIRTRLLLWILGTVIVGTAVAGAFTTKLSADALRAAILGEQSAAVSGATRLLDASIEKILRSLNDVGRDNAIVSVAANPGFKSSVEMVSERFAETVQGINGVSVMGLIAKNGLVVASSNPDAIGKQNLGDREYFKVALEGNTHLSKPSLSRATGKPSVFAAAPVSAAGKIDGVLYMTIDLNDLTEEALNIKIGKQGYPFILQANGTILSHPNKELVFKNVASESWARSMISEKKGTLSYVFMDENRLAAFHTANAVDWVIALTAEESDVMSAVSTITMVTASVIALLVVAIICIVVLVVRNITRALSEEVAFAEAVADGELDRELRITRKDEIGKLGKSLQIMVANLRQTIRTTEQKTAEAEEQGRRAAEAMQEAKEAKLTADNAHRHGMLAAAQRLETVVNAISAASDQLSAQVDEAERGAAHQALRASETATSMEQMNGTVLEVARNASETAHASEEAHNNATEGAAIVESVVKAIAAVNARTGETRESLTELNQKAEGIGRIMAVISDIADQTNLLALNAAIEAARAGEAGRGFAVVADEVRKLAEKTMTATREVGDAVNGIQQGTLGAAATMKKAVEAVEESNALAASAGEALKRIVTLIQRSSDQVRAIATASEEQSSTSEHISQAAEEVNRIASDTSRSMQEAASVVAGLTQQTQALMGLIRDMKNE